MSAHTVDDGGEIVVVLAGGTISTVRYALERAYLAALQRSKGRDNALDMVLEQAIVEMKRAEAIAAMSGSGHKPRVVSDDRASFVSTSFAAQRLRRSERTVRRRAASGKIPGAQRSQRNDWLVPVSYLTKGP